MRRTTVLVLAPLLALSVGTPVAAQEPAATPSPSSSPSAHCPYVEWSVDRTTVEYGRTVTFTARRHLGAPDQRVTARWTRTSPEPVQVLHEDTSTDETATWTTAVHQSMTVQTSTTNDGDCTPLGRPDGQVFTITVVPHRDCGPVVEVAETAPAWGLDGKGGATVTVRTPPSDSMRDIVLYGYTRPTSSTEFRELARKKADENGDATFQLPLTGSTRLYAFGGGCVFSSRQHVVNVQARLAGLTAYRHGVRDYAFSTFYAGPRGKVGNLYRVTAQGREVLTSQTRMSAELVSIRRLFTGSGRFGFVLRTGDDINSVGASTNVRPTVVH